MNVIFSLWWSVALCCVAQSGDESLADQLCDQWELGSDLAMDTYLRDFASTPIGQLVASASASSQSRSPTWYLPQVLIDHHLSKFLLRGAAFLESASALYASDYGRASSIGAASQTISTLPEMQEALLNCSASPQPKPCALDALGVDASLFGEDEQWMLIQGQISNKNPCPIDDMRDNLLCDQSTRRTCRICGCAWRTTRRGTPAATLGADCARRPWTRCAGPCFAGSR